MKVKWKHNYDDLLKAGFGLRMEVFKFLKYVWETELIPRKWDLTTLMQVYNKGPEFCLRFVHLKHWLPRLFDGLVLSKIKPKIVAAMSKFQIGAKPGHMPREHIFVVRSLIDLYKSKNIPLLCTSIDISQYFDKHPLLEGQDCIAHASVDKKCYRLLYKLNANTTVQVKTAVGLSEMAVTSENTAQGSKSAGIICSLSLS